METILFFYQQRATKELTWEKRLLGEGTYHVIRVGLPSSFLCFGEERFVTTNEPVPKDLLGRILDRLFGWRRRQQTNKVQTERNDMAERHSQTAPPKQPWQQLLADIARENAPIRIAWENIPMDKMMQQPFWQPLLCYPQFIAYRTCKWAGQLMRYLIPGEVLILGYADCLFQLLCEYGRHIKNIRWFLPRAKHTNEFTCFLEDYYEEYGMIITVYLQPAASPVSYHPQSENPVTVLDFSGNASVSALAVADGSVWLDMDAVDEKQKKLQMQTPFISYHSLKNEWKHGCNLDTCHKQGYNT